MHQIRPFIEKIRLNLKLEKFPDEKERIAFIHGCVRDMTNDTNMMVAFVMEYLKQCGIEPTLELVISYLSKISTDELIRGSVEVLVRRHIIEKNKETSVLKFLI